MIRVTVELLPLGFEVGKRLLGQADIWNDASGTKSVGNYKFRLFKAGIKQAVWKQGEVKGFPRLRLGAWDLLLRVLLTALAHRNITAVDEAIAANEDVPEVTA